MTSLRARFNPERQLRCKVFPLKHYQDKIRPYIQLPSHRNITGIVDVILGETKAYVFFEKDFGDMHSYVRSCKRLREEEAARLFKQIVSAVAHCHQSAIVLGDLKLRKFVFSNEERTQLRLESLEDTHIIKGEDDALSDKHGCPAYVSPEILNTTGTYSGKSADVWSLGVMLYTLLVGRYPFHDSDPSTLFSKIRRGQFCIPDYVSPKARCLIRSLLRREPSERLTAPEILLHPWFEAVLEPGYADQDIGSSDQIVPEFHGDSDDMSSFFLSSHGPKPPAVRSSLQGAKLGRELHRQLASCFSLSLFPIGCPPPCLVLAGSRGRKRKLVCCCSPLPWVSNRSQDRPLSHQCCCNEVLISTILKQDELELDHAQSDLEAMPYKRDVPSYASASLIEA
ncbi:tribbles-like protein 1 isoform B [Alligator mississippiensis]|uniref:Tribbles-like protein 1 isoform B n=1 Tax=Alligator mississippiensis TaxID=8496 RepID=A0A151P8D7_ALLMI|nr:tribbles-like protein 1 isoform B [Alligator mississippiensis]